MKLFWSEKFLISFAKTRTLGENLSAFQNALIVVQKMSDYIYLNETHSKGNSLNYV